MAGAAAARAPWVYGPLPDLLIGCGGLYAIGFAVLLLTWDAQVGATLFYLLPMVVLAISLPHYGATLARAYGSREQTLRYAAVTIHATLLLVAWFVLGTWNALAGSLMVTLYLSWSPWHYSGQNYGLALMFLGRAGVAISPRVKTAFWWSFVLSYALTLLNLHAKSPGYSYNAATTDTAAVQLISLQIPNSVRGPIFLAIAVAYVVSLVVAGRGLVRAGSERGSLRSLAPVAAMVFSQALWFVAPYAAMQWLSLQRGTDGTLFLQQAILWVAIAHAAQYVWITSHYARSTSSWRGQGRYYGRIFLFSSVAWTVPALLFGPSTLGSVSYAGFPLLVAAFVNLHHFVLDGAIWKLRNTRVASILIRDEADTSAGPESIGRRGVRIGVAAGVAVAIACGLFQVFQMLIEVAVPLALDRGQVGVASALLDAGEPFAIGSVPQRVDVGAVLLDAGDREAAERIFEGAVSASPDAYRAHYLLGTMRVQDGDLLSGIEHLRSALAIRPDFGPARRQLHDAMRRARQSELGGTASPPGSG